MQQVLFRLLFLVGMHFAVGKDFLPPMRGILAPVDPNTFRLEIQEALSRSLGLGHGVDAQRLEAMNTTLTPLFTTLPKNTEGLLTAPAMRYAVQRYFAKNHGWVIKGFETNAGSFSAGQDAGILRTKVPGYVEALLEKQISHGGFALPDLMTMVAAVEQLIYDDVAKGLAAAYRLNKIVTTAHLDQTALMKILKSYIIVEMLERDPNDIEQHKEDKATIWEAYPNWAGLLHFVESLVHTDGLARQATSNSFITQSYSFEDTTRIAQRISNEYGRWGNDECMGVRGALIEMDPHNTGRVPLSSFYRKASESQEFGFQESEEYLRSLGALDESSSWLGPQVIIPNYAYGMSNCISSTLHYSVCCLNECEVLMEQLEGHFSKSSVATAEIIQIVETMSSLTTDARKISTLQRARLEDIAAHHGGLVPLHGRLFAQWLHYAFPRDCPFPHVSGDVQAKSQGEWMSAGAELTVTDEVLQAHIANNTQSSPEAGDALWSFEEELLTVPAEPFLRRAIPWQGFLSSCLRLFAGGIVASGILVSASKLQKGIATKMTDRLSSAKVGFEPKSHLV